MESPSERDLYLPATGLPERTRIPEAFIIIIACAYNKHAHIASSEIGRPLTLQALKRYTAWQVGALGLLRQNSSRGSKASTTQLSG